MVSDCFMQAIGRRNSLPDKELTEQGNPEPGICQFMGTLGHVRGDGSRANAVRTEGSGTNGCDGTKHLRGNEREAHVHASQCLQENDTEAEALNRVQDSQPQPETTRSKCTASHSSTDPGEIVANARDGPPNLDESWCAQATSEDGKEPTVLLRESADDEEEDTPDSTEEDNAEDDDLPCVGVGGAPQDWKREKLVIKNLLKRDMTDETYSSSCDRMAH